MSLTLRYAARSDVGLLREGNEDSAYAGPRLLAVADGMGGHAAGEVASSVAIAALAPLDEDAPGADMVAALRDAVQSANDHLRDMVAADNALEGMGTTLTALLRSGQRLALVHVGDSRAYLLRDHQLTQVTRDHTFVQNLVDEGKISPEEASTHPQRSLITRALDGRGEVEADLSVREARAGDRWLLCTDGLSGLVSAETIRATLQEAAHPRDAVDRLVELALRGGGPDNVTVIVADIVEDDGHRGVAPVVDGAAADGRRGSEPSPHTAAGRAALASPRPPVTEPDEEDVPGHRGRVRLVIVGAVVMVVIAGAIAATWAYIRSQWYVGAAGVAPAADVAVYRGVSGSVLGIDLSHVHERSNLPVKALPPFEQDHVREGIPADSLADGRRIVGRLRSESCSTVRAPATSRGHPAPTASPLVTPRPATSPARVAARPSPSPSPTPPPPPWCEVGP